MTHCSLYSSVLSAVRLTIDLPSPSILGSLQVRPRYTFYYLVASGQSGILFSRIFTYSGFTWINNS